MTLPRLHCGHASLPVGARIGRGGEGEIYPLTDASGRAVKLYLNPDLARETKVRAMISGRLADACPNVAFPKELVRHADGRFAGFTMTEIRRHQPIHELIGSGSRRRYFPHAGWPFLVRTAINVARAVASVHAADIIIGDINSSGFLVAQDATVKLIDADSFQIGAHRCRVGMPDYTPPELQGIHLGTVDRTKDHDAFGLAVMLFQILMLGRHPFSGVARGRPIPIENAIAGQRFAYSELRQTGLSPPPATLRLHDLPRAIRFAFERAFFVGNADRPTAAEWARDLIQLESMLLACPADARHTLSSPFAPCPWCRIERGTGRTIFAHHAQQAVAREDASMTQLRRDVHHAIGTARRDAGENLEPLWPRLRASPSKAARTLYSKEQENPGYRVPPALQVLGFSNNIPSRFVAERHAVSVEAERGLKKWRTGLGIGDVYKICDGLLHGLGEVEQHRAHRPTLIARALARIIADRVAQIMATRPIAGAGIGGIGSVLQAQLARWGIVTAADIIRDTLAALPGLGERRIVALLFWREKIGVAAEREAAGSSVSTAAAMDAAGKSVDRHIATLEASVRRAVVDLAASVARVRAAASTIDHKLDDILARCDRAKADLDLLGIAADPRLSSPTTAPQLPAKPKKQKSKPMSGKKVARACPQCGGPMIKRWAPAAAGNSALFLGCSAYPRCNGRRPVRGRKTSP